MVPHPLVSVLTSIGMEHMKFLGDTIRGHCLERRNHQRQTSGGYWSQAQGVSISLLEICHQKHCRYRLLTETQRLFILRIFVRDRYLIMRTAVISGTRYMAGCCRPWNASIAIAAVELLCELPAGEIFCGIFAAGAMDESAEDGRGIASA